jgi:hypothetical protein
MPEPGPSAREQLSNFSLALIAIAGFVVGIAIGAGIYLGFELINQ